MIPIEPSDAKSQKTTQHLTPQPQILEFNPGVVILERFKIIELLGRGGMGSVYKVENIETRTTYALKFLHKQHNNDANWRRFDIEARTANKLDHPNLIKVYESGLLPDGQPFFIMDLVHGDSLAEILKARGRLTLNQAIKIFIQVGFALSYAHANGVIHRDIKPSNIMLQRKDDDATLGSLVKVVDFGIAKFTGQDEFNQQTLTRTGEIFGSPLYMSPEQCMGTGVDHRSDLYSLGCVIYEALTGAPPLVGDSALSTMMKHQSEAALSLKEASMGIEFPDKIEQIVSKLLAKDIDARYQSAQILTEDLVNFDSGQSTATVLGALQAPVQKIHRKHTYLNLILVGLLIFLAGLAIGYQIPHNGPPEKVPESSVDYTNPFASSNAEMRKEIQNRDIAVISKYTNGILKGTENQLNLMESDSKPLSTIDTEKKLRTFHFPSFIVGTVTNSPQSPVEAVGNITFPASASLAFNPSDLFKRHPGLFRKFQSDDFETLILTNKRKELTENDLSFADINKVLQKITHLKSVHTLRLEETDPKPEGWAHISNFPNLKVLALSHISFPSNEIAKYKHFKQLEYFKLVAPQVITPVLEKFRGSKTIKILALPKCFVYDNDVRIISTLSHLTELDLRDTKITDAAIPLLPVSLRSLEIRGCNITPNSIASYARLKNLRSLKLSADDFTPKDIEHLRQVLPKTHIEGERIKGVSADELLDRKSRSYDKH